MRSTAFVLAIAAAAGAGTMIVELAAVRLLAPWFGTSSGVWTNVIGVILLALALGYLLGARLSQRPAPARRLGATLLLAAAFTAWLPALAPRVAEFFLPQGMALDEVAALMTWGSLAASIVLFLPAALCLGCVGPLAVEALQTSRGGHAGDAGGRVLCASTLGSLAGTFSTTHLLLPYAGLTRTFLGAAVVLGATGLAARVGGKGSSPATVAALALLAAGLTFSRLRMPDPPEGMRVLEERQSAYQSIRILAEPGESGLRRLAVNESLDSFQSVWSPAKGPLPAGYYYNLFALPPWWSAADGDTGPRDWRLLTLGLGAGSTVRVLEGALPKGARLQSLGVEIDPAVVELGRRHFELEESAERVVLAGVDARAVLALDLEPFDEIVLDAFANNMEVPAHLSSLEFFHELHGALRPGGWLAVNAAGFGLEDPVVDALARTLAESWERDVLIVRVPFSRNCVLFARRDGELCLPGRPGWRTDHPGLAELTPLFELEGAWRLVEPGGDDNPKGPAPLTDDRNPIDRLQLESIRNGRSAWLEPS